MEARRLTLTDGVVLLDRFTADDMDAHLAGEDEEQARRFGWWPSVPAPISSAGCLTTTTSTGGTAGDIGWR